MGEYYRLFHLQFHMENQIFYENARGEVARILREVADKVEYGNPNGKIMDINGNSIGKHCITKGKMI